MASAQRLIIACAFLCMLSLSSYASWPTEVDSAVYVDNGIFPRVIVDPIDHSVFVVYINLDRLFVKKYDRYGDPLWGGNRITLADTTEMFGRFSSNIISQWGALVPDDSGGLFVAWQDYRFAIYDEFTALTNDIYIQYINRNGNTTMGANGKRINKRRDDGHLLGDMKSDYHGGVYVGWSRDSTETMSVIKRIQSNGNITWERYLDENSIDICATNSQGEVFVNLISQFPGKRQKLDINGDLLWPDTLLGLIPDVVSYRSGRAFSNKNGGVYGMFRIGYETRYNRILTTGERVFGEGVILPATSPPTYIVPDEKLGVFYQSGQASSVLRRVKKDGSLAWPTDTIKFCPNTGCSGVFGIVPDKVGGVLGIWSLGGVGSGISFHVQRVDSTGEKLWAANGIEVYDSSFEIEPSADSVIPIVSDGRGGAIINWVLSYLGLRIYIKQISVNGILGEVITGIDSENISYLPQLELHQNYPNPFNATTQIAYRLKQSENVNLSIYNLLGQKITTLVNGQQTAGSHTVVFDAAGLPSGIYFYRLFMEDSISLYKKMLIIN
ncbi:MAG: T9SS type A sorting domain-containing protein [Calditrichia bacterium]